MPNHCVHNVSVFWCCLAFSLGLSPEYPTNLPNHCVHNNCLSSCVPWVLMKIYQIIVHTTFPCCFFFLNLCKCPLSTHQHLPDHCVRNVSVFFILFCLSSGVPCVITKIYETIVYTAFLCCFFFFFVSLQVSPEYSWTSIKSLCTQRFRVFSSVLYLFGCPLSKYENLPKHCVHNVSVLFFFVFVSLRVSPEYSWKSTKSVCTRRFSVIIMF